MVQLKPRASGAEPAVVPVWYVEARALIIVLDYITRPRRAATKNNRGKGNSVTPPLGG